MKQNEQKRRFFQWNNKTGEGKEEEYILLDNSQDPTRDVVRLIEIYATHRPLNAPDAFYLCAKVPTENCWYKNQRMGENHLSKMMGKICEAAGIKGHFTNNSWRKRINNEQIKSNSSFFEKESNREEKVNITFTEEDDDALLALGRMIDSDEIDLSFSKEIPANEQTKNDLNCFGKRPSLDWDEMHDQKRRSQSQIVFNGCTFFFDGNCLF